MLFNILKIEPIFGNFVIQDRFSMLFNAGLSIFRNRSWVYMRFRFDIGNLPASLSSSSHSTIDGAVIKRTKGW